MNNLSKVDSKKTINKSLPLIAYIFIIALILYSLVALYYSKNFFLGTQMNGINIGNLSADEVKEEVVKYAGNYQLEIKGRNGLVDYISKEDIALTVDIKTDINQLLENQNGFLWIFKLLSPMEYKVDTGLLYSHDSLLKRIEQLIFFKEEHSIPPTNAYLSDYTEKGYIVVEEKEGALVNKELLTNEVVGKINELGSNLSIESIGAYEKAEITYRDEVLNKKASVLNKHVLVEIEYEFGDKKEIINGDLIHQWITMNDNYEVSVDSEKVREFVDYIGKTYNTFGKTRILNTSYGKTVTVRGGDYGWWLNRGEEVKEIIELIMSGTSGLKEAVYYQKANQHGEDDIGNTYIEVNLTAQELFFYKDGKLIVQTEFVSGNISREWGTPTGTFPILYRERNATLTGEDYETPVNYWMPFYGNVGFHDAEWRNSFGKDIYLTNGSHGCINMPPEAAKIMFEHVERGVAVYVYELLGTEKYDINDKVF